MSEQHQNPEIQAPENEQEQQSRLALIYHGVAGQIAQTRINRAASVMERMDHKNALYNDLGHMALNGGQAVGGRTIDSRMGAYFSGNHGALTDEQLDLMDSGYLPIGEGEFQAADTANGMPARPRTRAERRMDRRIDKRNHKSAVNDIYAQRYNKIYGTVDTRPDLMIRERVADKFLGGSVSGPIESIDIPGRMHDMMFGAADEKGTSKMTKVAQNAEIKHHTHKGHLTATEARLLRNEVNAQPTQLGAETHKIVNGRQRKADKQLRQVINQEFLSRFRNWRRERAIGRIQKAHAAVERHNQSN